MIFKIDNSEEQEVFNIRSAVESGELVLDPFQLDNVTQQWIDAGWVRHCHARAAIPNNPKTPLPKIVEAVQDAVFNTPLKFRRQGNIMPSDVRNHLSHGKK